MSEKEWRKTGSPIFGVVFAFCGHSMFEIGVASLGSFAVAWVLSRQLFRVKLNAAIGAAIHSASVSESRLLALLENLTTGVVVHSANSAIELSNGAASEILGLSIDQLRGRVAVDPYWHFLQADGSSLPFDEYPVNRVIHHRETIRNRVIGVVRPDRPSPTWALCNAYPELDALNRLNRVVVNFVDITQMKEATHALEKSQKELIDARDVAENATRLKSRFLDIAAHELRTPVTAFSLLLQFTQRQLEKGHAVEVLTLRRLGSQADRLARLVVDLLDVSRLDRGLVQLQWSMADLGVVVTECIEPFKLKSPDRPFRVFLPDHPILVKMDPVRIYQVLSNLIDNAVKYTPAESPIEVRIRVLPNSVWIDVKDDGPGISPTLQANLFSPLERGDSEQVELSSGLGLGLYICRRILELHGGTIRVKSHLGEGSEFSFELPLGSERK